MDSMVVQLDASEPSGTWRRIMHDGDLATEIVATATARLSQTFLAQGFGERRQQKAPASSLKVRSSEVDGTISPSLGVDRREVRQGNNGSALRYPPTTTASELESSIKLSTTTAVSGVSAGPAVGQQSTLSTGSLTPSGPTMAAGARTRADERACLSPGHVQCLVTKMPPASIASPPRASLKRARPLSDVDGPYTSNQGCKKRRLLRHLVTSRLSKRFSIPATHVPNLENTMGMTGGGGMEKRFLRLAAVAAARRVAVSPILGAAAQPQLRQQPHSTPPSEVLRRAAIMNRFRMRTSGQAAKHGEDAAVAEMAASAAMLRFAPGVNAAVGVSVLARFPRSSASGPSQAGILIPPPPPAPRPSLPMSTSLQSIPRMALFLRNTDDPAQVSTPTSAAGSSRDRGPCQARQSVAPSTPGLALPAAIAAAGPLSRVAAIARRRSISPSVTPPGSPSKGLRPADASPRMIATGAGRLPPVSPRLQPLTSLDDEEGVAFPTSEHESRYESGDESDDVYSDFSLVFGGGGGDGAEDDDDRSRGDMDGYEDFMDDLDGIPWSAR